MGQGENWTTVTTYSEPKVIDFVTMQSGTFLDVGAFDLEPGSYTGVRLVLADGHQIEVSEGENVLFTGWSFRDFPGMHSFDDPRYTVQLSKAIPQE